MPTGPGRRRFLQTVGTAAVVASAGCPLSSDARGPDEESTEPPPGADITGNWRRFQSDRRNRGYRPDAAGPTAAPTHLWTLETGGNVMGTPVIVDGTVYAGSKDGTLYAVDAATGTVTWRHETDDAIARTPTVADGTVYVGSEDGTLSAIGTAEGTLEWEFDATVGTSQYADPMVRTPPVVDDASVYAGDTRGRLFAVDRQTGEKRWTFPTGGSLGIVDAPALVDGVLYATSYDGSMYAVDAADGTERWAYSIGNDAAWSAPTVAHGTVFAGANDGHLHAVDRRRGTERWRFDTGGNVFSSPAVGTERVYVGGADSVFALDVADGRRIWRFETDGYVYSSPSVVGDTVYVGSYDGYVYALDATDRSITWAHDVGAETVSGPAVVDGAVLVGDFDGDVHALGPAPARTERSTTTAPPPRSKPETPWWSESGYDGANTSANTAVTAPRDAVGVETVLGPSGGVPPAIVDGAAYVVRPDETAKVDLATGDQGWSVPFAGDRVAGTPNVTGDTVYVHGRQLRAIDRLSGEQRWTIGGGGDLFGGTPPRVVDGTVYVGRSLLRPAAGDDLGRSGVYAIDAADGSREWHADEAAVGYGALAVVGGSVYFGSEDDYIYAIDAETGEREWRFQTGHSVLSGPAVADGTVYAGSLDNTVYALDASTGDVRWTVETFGVVHTSPAVADGTVFAVSGGQSRVGNVYAIDAVTGKIEWTFECKQPVPYATPIVGDGVVYVQLAEADASNPLGTIYGLDAADGSIVTRATPESAGRVAFAPVLADGALYAQVVDTDAVSSTTTDGESADLPTPELARLVDGAGTETVETCEPRRRTRPSARIDGPWSSEQYDAANAGVHPDEIGVVYLTTHADGIYAIDAADGTVRWRSEPIVGVQSAPTVAGGRVLVGVNREPYGVYALDASDGAELWTARVGDCKTTAALADGMAYAGTSRNELVALDVDSGTTSWRFAGNDRLLASPAVRDGTVYAGDESGDVYAVDARSGERVWANRAEPRDEIKTPVATDGSRVYARDVDGALRAFDAETGRVRWSYRETVGYATSGPATGGDHVFVAGESQIHAVVADGGDRAWATAFDGARPTTAAVDEDWVWVGTDAGRLHALDRSDGRERWHVDVGGPIEATPIAGRERVVVATRAGVLAAVDRADGALAWTTEPLGSTDKMNVDGTLAAVAGLETGTSSN